MGAGASSRSPSTVLSPDNLPKQLFVEGAGSVRVNGKFVLRTDNFPIKSSSSRKGGNASGCNRSVWFSKDDDGSCWMGFIDARKKERDGDPDQRKWVICTDREILYVAPITGDKLMPRQGRWELCDGGAAPGPTVNLQPLPTAVRMSGWKGHHDILNGEYLPLDDGSKLLNGRPIFQHTPVVGCFVQDDKWRMYWSHGAWRVGKAEQLQSKQTHCMACAASDATHPTGMSTEVVWKGTASAYDNGKDDSYFAVMEGVSLATGMSAQVYVSAIDGDASTSFTVRPWFDTVEDLQAQAFATDTPSQRQQLFLDGKRLQGDGRVLAQHGVVAESTIQLVMLDEKPLLDGLFDESGAVRAVDVVGDPSPGSLTTGYYGGHYNPADGRIYLSPNNYTRAARFDPATGTWESFGDTFPEGKWPEDKWGCGAVSRIDNCYYQFPIHLSKVHRMLKIDPANSTAQEVGEDVRQVAGVKESAYCDAVANADGYIFGMPVSATCAIRFDPRTNELSTFGQLEDTGNHKYWAGVLGPSGQYIFCLPCLASRVLCIDTYELTLELIGPDFGRGDDKSYISQSKWARGALGGDDCIYGLAMNNSPNRLLRIDPASMTVSLFGPDLSRISASAFSWVGTTTGMDGCIYLTPFISDRVLRIDPFAGTVSTVGEAVPAAQLLKLSSGVVDSDGAIWFLPMHTPARMVRLAPRRPQTPLLTTLLRPEHHTVLQDGLLDLRCYGPALAVALWREAVRAGGDFALVSALLEAAATALPTVITASIKYDNGSTACMLLRTILAVCSPQEKVALAESKAETQKRSVVRDGNTVARVVRDLVVAIKSMDHFSPPYEAIRTLATDPSVLPQCFAFSDKLRGMVLRMLYGVLSLEDSAPPAQPVAAKASGGLSSRVKPPTNSDISAPLAKRAIVSHLKIKWTDLAAAIQAIRRAPPALSANGRHRFAFLSHFTAASAILQAPAPNAWQPLPASADAWSWPPAPLVALRAAAKIAQRLGPDTVRSMWPVLAGAIASVLIRMVEAVRAELVHASDLLITNFDRERKSSLGTYQKQLRRVRRDPTFPEFAATAADLTKQLETLNRKQRRVQTTASFPELYSTAHATHTRFNDFLAQLAHKCAGAKALHAPLKGIARALEKLVLAPGVAAKVKKEGLEAVDATPLVDILRGSLGCPDFIDIVFILELLELLDVDMGDPKKAKAQGWDLNNFQIRIIHLKNRFTTPTSGGWADAMVNFTFVNDETQHVMELQIQHAQMLVVRKQGKAHDRYNSFRSAFELLEAVGSEPNDGFEQEDLSTPLQRLEQRMDILMAGMQQNEARAQQQMEQHQAKFVKLISGMQQQIDDLKVANEVLRSRIE